MTNESGRIKRSGYWYIFDKTHPYSGKQGYIAEHRIIMEKHIGRYLLPNEVIHHKDGNKTNNAIGNLEVFSSHGQHTKIAHPEIFERQRTIFRGIKPPNYNRIPHNCASCQKEFLANANRGRKYCSYECYWKSKIGKPAPNMEGLKLGRGWNKGIPFTWAKKGRDHYAFKHGKYSKYV